MPVESVWDVIIDLGLAWGLPFVLFTIWYFTIDKYLRVRKDEIKNKRAELKMKKAVLRQKGINVDDIYI